MRLATLIAACLMTLAAHSGDRPTGEAVYNAVSAEHREWYLESYRCQLEKARREFEAAEKKSPIRNRARRLASLSEQIEAVEAIERNDPPHLPYMMRGEIKVGRFGYIPRVNIVQVLGPQEVIVQFPAIKGSRPQRIVVGGGVVANVPGSPAKPPGPPFIVRGVDTDGMVDGAESVLIDGVLRVTGTETYATVTGGTNTAFVLEAFDASSVFNVANKESDGTIKTYER